MARDFFKCGLCVVKMFYVNSSVSDFRALIIYCILYSLTSDFSHL